MVDVDELVERHVASPVGVLRLVGDRANRGVCGVYFPGHKPAPACSGVVVDDHPVLDQLARELEGYFAGELRAFSVPLRPTGTEFQLAVWRALAEIPYGATRSYVAVAAAVGAGSGGVRAVAAANARNPLSIVVPCHRVIGSDGSLTGYAGGLVAKQHLLDLEGRVAGTQRQPGLF